MNCNNSGCDRGKGECAGTCANQEEPTDSARWIEWPGGECPVPLGYIAECQLRNGTKVIRQALYSRWHPTGAADDVVAYRVPYSTVLDAALDRMTDTANSMMENVRRINATEPVVSPTLDDTIGAMLAERGSRYGKFSKHADVTQGLKKLLFSCRIRDSLAPDQSEALDMICHKLGRIVNGDPDYADSWVDIAGYAKLVADRLQGLER